MLCGRSSDLESDLESEPQSDPETIQPYMLSEIAMQMDAGPALECTMDIRMDNDLSASQMKEFSHRKVTPSTRCQDETGLGE